MADHRIHRVLHRLAALLGANPRFGSDEDLKRFGDTATRLGYPWACTRMTSTSIPMPRCGTRLPSHSHKKGPQLDKYRAQQNAYDHAGFIEREQIGHVDFMVLSLPHFLSSPSGMEASKHRTPTLVAAGKRGGCSQPGSVGWGRCDCLRFDCVSLGCQADTGGCNVGLILWA